MSAGFMTAQEAAATLGVSRATLYAYVSRGLVRVHPAADDPRRRLYSERDIEVLKERKSVGRRPRDIAAKSLDWGQPVLPSGITLIDDGRLYYMGREAVDWSERASAEDTARLLWKCGDLDPFSSRPDGAAAWPAGMLGLAAPLPLTERCLALLPFVPSANATTWQRNRPRLWPGAAALLRAIAAAATSTEPSGLPVHEHLARAWRLNRNGADIVRRALVLLADHELNASSFAVRVVASTGASLGACLSAGVAALSGPLHGGTTSLVEILLEDIGKGTDPADIVEGRLRRGDGVPGFGHPLYPQGDPRAAALLSLLPPDPVRTAFIEAMGEITGKLPSVDFALACIRRQLKLPPGSALAIFTVGRAIGWIAHALEQAEENRLIRPRATYTGPPPQTAR